MPDGDKTKYVILRLKLGDSFGYRQGQRVSYRITNSNPDLSIDESNHGLYTLLKEYDRTLANVSFPGNVRDVNKREKFLVFSDAFAEKTGRTGVILDGKLGDVLYRNHPVSFSDLETNGTFWRAARYFPDTSFSPPRDDEANIKRMLNALPSTTTGIVVYDDSYLCSGESQSHPVILIGPTSERCHDLLKSLFDGDNINVNDGFFRSSRTGMYGMRAGIYYNFRSYVLNVVNNHNMDKEDNVSVIRINGLATIKRDSCKKGSLGISSDIFLSCVDFAPEMMID
ncbi:MAG: hypothetical protein ABIA21_02335 [Candidatus Aenigmatarchaeota archaeon]